MYSLLLALKSKTFWTLVLTVVANAVNANVQYIPTADMVYVNIALGALATIFHINPSQSYNGSQLVDKK